MTGLSAIAHDVDRQRLPSEQLRHLQPSCSNTAHVIMLNIFNSVLSQWRSRLRPAGLSALPPASCQDPAACDTGVADPGRSTSSPGDVRIYRDGAGGANNGGGVSGSGVACAAAPPPANPTAIWPTSRQGDRLGVYGHSAACASLPPQPWRGWRRRPQASSTRWWGRLRSAGPAAPPPR